MKKMLIVLIFAALVLTVPGGAYYGRINFLNATVDCAAATTLVNGTGFTSLHINTTFPSFFPIGAITVTFTRAAGSSSTVCFEFQVSADNNITWSTAYYVSIDISTNETAVSNVVRVTKLVQLHGISHIRLYRIVNNDASNNLTACNASLSF